MSQKLSSSQSWALLLLLLLLLCCREVQDSCCWLDGARYGQTGGVLDVVLLLRGSRGGKKRGRAVKRRGKSRERCGVPPRGTSRGGNSGTVVLPVPYCGLSAKFKIEPKIVEL